MEPELTLPEQSKLPNPALHASILSMLSKCGMMVEHRYVYGRKAPPGVALHVGTGLDVASSFDLRHKMEKGTPAIVDLVREAAQKAVEAAWTGEGVLLSAEEKSQGEASVRREAMAQAADLAACSNRVRTPKRSPIAVQERIRLELAGFPFDLEGTIDEIEPLDDGLEIIDTKSAARSPALTSKGVALDPFDHPDVQGNPQLDLYTVLATIKRKPKKVLRVGHDVFVKLKGGPSFVPIRTKAITRFDSILQRAELAARTFQKGVFYPADPTGPSGWVCSPDYCGYFNICPQGQRRTVQG